MAVVSSPSRRLCPDPSVSHRPSPCPPSPCCSVSWHSISLPSSNSFAFLRTQLPVPAISRPIRVSNVFTHQHTTIPLDKSKLRISEGTSEDEFWAAACLRVRTFNKLRPDSFGVDDHKKYLAELEYEAIKERIAGKRVVFKKVSCINATLPLAEISNLALADDLCATCKFSDDGEDRVVVGSLDLNQCISLPDEIAGMKPKGIGADFARAYLSNVCVAKEMHRNGLGYALVEKAKTIAEAWGISDLYVHVAFDNEPAKNLYLKSGFVHESDEPTWQARFLDRPRRILLWTALSELL